MNIKTATARCDRLYPNSVEYEDKIDMLSELDGRIFEESVGGREGAPESFEGYELATPGTTELLAPFPYDDVYVKYLSMKIDLLNGDIVGYNNKALIFNTAYSDLSDFIVRTRRRKRVVRFNVGGEAV